LQRLAIGLKGLKQQQGYNPQIAVEFGRKIMASQFRPSFSELEEFLRGEA
jgi:chemotaxis protein MotA